MYINMVSSANMIHSCLLSFAHNLPPLEKYPSIPFSHLQFTYSLRPNFKAYLFFGKLLALDGEFSNCAFIYGSHIDCVEESSGAICLLNCRFDPRTRITGSGLGNLQMICSLSESSTHYSRETQSPHTHSYTIIMEFRVNKPNKPGCFFI